MNNVKYELNREFTDIMFELSETTKLLWLPQREHETLKALIKNARDKFSEVLNLIKDEDPFENEINK